ncbi:GSCFA domain-containing protein [Maribacter algarum]|uniref:GSCFA domain-containing protein n=1 Tax=Maribacter algarum (ex Zhang et al. 2020) TaxID=2578118 RepID=A0A5S3PDX4_9FLAO|nr:GSCFA domain-containing protein [Maribacter algarum]TMM52188.1 GSCFA domain-containing protein [Maribacter algarum]
MKLQTQIPFTRAQNQIGYESQLLILGSCFAENIGDKLDYFKFQSLQNPFGILFHPLAIEKLISKAVKSEIYSEKDIFFLNERWHCFDSHSDLSNSSKKELLEELNSGLEKTYQQITKATHVLITLGTAWVYQNIETDTVVTNCHKVPQKEFSKELLSTEEIQNSLENAIQCVQSVNQNAKFIFTVSPVRHLKDGFVENQRSKAHLISAIHQIMETSYFLPRTSYFESYELVMDELRDYRFYEADMIHPNQIAIDYIWEKFKEVWISLTAYTTMEKVDTVQKGLQHRPYNPDSGQHQSFMKSLERKITYLQEEYPFMKFEH